MKIALISDLHAHKGTISAVQEIIDKHSPDALIASGDLTSRGDLSFLSDLFEVFKKFGRDIFVIWGNSDDERSRKMIADSKFNLNLQSKKLGKYKVYGIGDFDDPPKVNPEKIKDSILVTHRPPTLSAVSKKLSNAPLFHISGHVHSRHTFKKFPSTTLIQVPSLMAGEYAIFNPDLNSIEFLKLHLG